MGKRAGKYLSLSGLDTATKSREELIEIFNDLMSNGIHGLCFSLYEDGQVPGDQISEEQVRRRIGIIAPYSKWVRSFSCTEGNEFIPKIAKEFGLKTLVGAWLGSDEEKNAAEIQGLKKLTEEGLVDIAAIGNEVMYREDLTEEQLLTYLFDFKKDFPETQMGYVDAYYEFSARPKITEACDVILSNCYPFWEGCHIDYSLPYMKDMYHQAKDAGAGKKVIITETGWPSEGGGFEGSLASEENFLRYFINAQQWCEKDNIEMFYFSSFDESWKTGDEGDVGAYWGLWDKNELLKW
ncbi:glycosyl hydrolase family 17 protein [Bacteroidia bacterium]|nr:glycosyl hydrolase family 17 protein [Bacteroidia bacterium]